MGNPFCDEKNSIPAVQFRHPTYAEIDQGVDLANLSAGEKGSSGSL